MTYKHITIVIKKEVLYAISTGIVKFDVAQFISTASIS